MDKVTAEAMVSAAVCPTYRLYLQGYTCKILGYVCPADFDGIARLGLVDFKTGRRPLTENEFIETSLGR